jgi:molecular chaperone GrpE
MIEDTDGRNEEHDHRNGQEEESDRSDDTPQNTLGRDDEDPSRDEEIHRLATELSDLKDRHLRSLAEMENVRRRSEKERVDLVKYGLETFMKELLPVLDSLLTALPDDESASRRSKEDDSYFSGMLMVKKQLLDVLQKNGLEPINAAGCPFDPNLHQAIQRVESADVTADTVKDEYARGYTLNGRLLRPAMVSVLTPT